MSYAVKYQYSFKSFQGDDGLVYFFVKDYSGPITILDGGANPFKLREFNTDNDFFKPVRGFQAEMEILATPSISLEDFIFNEDDSVQVQFWFNGSLFWVGWLMNDDIQENWIDTYHYITLRATDGLGTISGDPVTTVDGLETVEGYIAYAIDSTPIPSFIGTVIINNLFYDGMQDKADGNFHPLNQVELDGKTFEGDGNDRILEKINKAWSQTIYQYRGAWWIVRQEEFLHDNTIRGIVKGAFSNTALTKTFTVNIGRNEGIKPIMPEMLRTIRRPYKETKLTYKYEFPKELLCNQSFLNGDLIPPTTNTYTIDCWTWSGLSGSQMDIINNGLEAQLTTATGDVYRQEVLDGDGNITDNYVVLDLPGASGRHVLHSQPFYINTNDTLRLSFDFRIEGFGAGPVNELTMLVSVDTGTETYYLDSDGEWNELSAYGTRWINIPYSVNELRSDWKTVEIKSDAIPSGGEVKFWLYGQSEIIGSKKINYKALEIEIREASKQPGVIGDFDRYTLAETVRQNYEEQSFLDDSNNRSHKGALFYSNNLTGDNWYRYDYNTERLTFKRHNAIAKMLLNRKNRYKIEINALGITYTDGSAIRPVWLMNKFIFPEDAPTKQFMITNLQEMDFYNGTWRASLIEVWDSADDDDPDNYPTHDYGNIYEKDVNN